MSLSGIEQSSSNKCTMVGSRKVIRVFLWVTKLRKYWRRGLFKMQLTVLSSSTLVWSVCTIWLWWLCFKVLLRVAALLVMVHGEINHHMNMNTVWPWLLEGSMLLGAALRSLHWTQQGLLLNKVPCSPPHCEHRHCWSTYAVTPLCTGGWDRVSDTTTSDRISPYFHDSQTKW